MRRLLIFGNSGSGKSTLAKSLALSEGLAHFDLDPIAWLPTDPPQRRPLQECEAQINAFIQAHESWVIEGCYADLMHLVSASATEVIWLKLSVDACVEHAKARPWEPHKYPSKEAQDANLNMLLGWIRSYPEREDTCALKAHLALYDGFQGKKSMVTKALDLS